MSGHPSTPEVPRPESPIPPPLSVLTPHRTPGRCDEPLRLGVLIGGGGRTLLNLDEHIRAGQLDAVIASVIAPRADLPGVQRARDAGLDVTIVDAPTAGMTDAAHAQIHARLLDCGVDLICLAGYMRLFRIGEEFVHRVINIHPALLPSFGGRGMFGMRVHDAVLRHGCKVSGCTVHLVDEVYDRGPIILQRTCPVEEGDDAESLAARVFALECSAYPEAIALFRSGRLAIRGRTVEIRPAAGQH